MAVVWKKTESAFSIVVWHSTEPIELLLENAALSRWEIQELNSFKSESRKREWLTVRNALQQITDKSKLKIIEYDRNGKPHLEGNSISISHSHEFIAVMLAGESRIGIDIEVVHPRIEILSKKFLNDTERNDLTESNRHEKLHAIWGAKEVLFKIHSIGGIDFRKDLLVHPFIYESPGKLMASINKSGHEKKYDVSYEKLRDFMLTWSIEG